MKRMIQKVRYVVFGAVVAASLGFGATQAAAAPRSGSACDGDGQTPVDSCPRDKKCDWICPGGACLQNCCTCPI